MAPSTERCAASAPEKIAHQMYQRMTELYSNGYVEKTCNQMINSLLITPKKNCVHIIYGAGGNHV